MDFAVYKSKGKQQTKGVKNGKKLSLEFIKIIFQAYLKPKKALL